LGLMGPGRDEEKGLAAILTSYRYFLMV
jgi:hypothetical protein